MITSSHIAASRELHGTTEQYISIEGSSVDIAYTTEIVDGVETATLNADDLAEFFAQDCVRIALPAGEVLNYLESVAEGND